MTETHAVCSGLPSFPPLKVFFTCLSHKQNTERSNLHYFLKINLLVALSKLLIIIFIINNNRKPLITWRTNIITGESQWEVLFVLKIVFIRIGFSGSLKIQFSFLDTKGSSLMVELIVSKFSSNCFQVSTQRTQAAAHRPHLSFR